MLRISSRSTFLYKRIFPLFWFGFLAIFIMVPLFGKRPEGGFPVVFFIMPVIMAGFGYFLLRKFVFDLADEVSDTGDSLVVRFGSEQERIPLCEIINVSYTYMTSPSRVTLTVRNPGRFGKEVSFCPPQRFLPFARSPIVANLIERIDAARRA
jgi:hypothetical protein